MVLGREHSRLRVYRTLKVQPRYNDLSPVLTCVDLPHGIVLFHRRTLLRGKSNTGVSRTADAIVISNMDLHKTSRTASFMSNRRLVLDQIVDKRDAYRISTF